MVSRFELFTSNITYIVGKFFDTKKSLFKGSLSDLVKNDSPVREWDGYEYTYGHLKDLNIGYSIFIDPDTLEGFMFMRFPGISMNGKNYMFFSSKMFQGVEGICDNLFKESHADTFSKYIHGGKINEDLVGLTFMVMSRSIIRLGVKRLDKSMEILTVILISKFFEFNNESYEFDKIFLRDYNLDEKLDSLASVENMSTLVVSEDILRKNTKKILKYKINPCDIILNVRVMK